MRIGAWQIATLAFALLGLAGCATARIDWQGRVGTYTFDQSVLEMGPPDKVAELTDGTKVAEWLTNRGSSGGSGFMTFGGGSYYYGGPFVHHYYEPQLPDRFLRLTFGPDGMLREWRRVSK